MGRRSAPAVGAVAVVVAVVADVEAAAASMVLFFFTTFMSGDNGSVARSAVMAND